MNTGIGRSKYCIPQPFSHCLISLCRSLFDFNSIKEIFSVKSERVNVKKNVVLKKIRWAGPSQRRRGPRRDRRDRAEQRLRMCRDKRGLGSKLVSFAKGFSKHSHILAIFKVDSEYLRFPFKVKVDYFILYSNLVSTSVIFLLLFSMNKRRRTNEESRL